MRLFLVILVLALAGLVFGTAGFFGYQLFLKSEKKEQKEVVVPLATPLPDESIAAFNQVLELKKHGKLLEVRDALLAFLKQFPQSSMLSKAKTELGEIQIDWAFSPTLTQDKLEYTVVPGDSLIKIAHKTVSNAELIMRANNLASIQLQIGQKLWIPQLKIGIVIDRAYKTLTLLNHGEFFKEYAILDFQGPSASLTLPLEAKITEKMAHSGSKRVAFGDKNYWGSERWIMLSLTGVIICSAQGGQTPSSRAGIVISQQDMEELFPLTSLHTLVTLQ